MRPGPGTIIADRFELRAKVGQGGMGSVYVARDNTTQRNVAVKVLVLDEPQDVVRFTREATLLAAIKHPNIVGYVAHGNSHGMHYLAQEWIDGITLSQRMQEDGLTARDAVAIGRGIADALSAAHRAGVLHRDVKPSNVILAGGSCELTKLVDFGVARKESHAGSLTRTGTVIGTPKYMSPEQARGEVTLTPATDVWSLGCVLYEALTGAMPFDGKTAMAVRAKVVVGKPFPLAILCPEAPGELVSLVNGMLAKSAGVRVQTGEDVAQGLRALPAIPEGPKRKRSSSFALAETPVQGAAPGGAIGNSFVLLGRQTPTPPEGDARVLEVAQACRMEVHLLDDGTAVLRSHEAGKPAALAAASAAETLRSHGSVTLFAEQADDTERDAIDRGADLLAHAQIESMFGDDYAEAGIRLDPLMARALGGDFEIIETPQGPMLGPRKRADR